VETNNPIVSSSQLTLNFEAGLAERYQNLISCINASIHSNRRPMKSIAIDMDLSPSDLSRKLADNPNDPRRFTVSDLENYIKTTGDSTPILWLVSKYCVDYKLKKEEAILALAKMVPEIKALLKEANGGNER